MYVEATIGRGQEGYEVDRGASSGASHNASWPAPAGDHADLLASKQPVSSPVSGTKKNLRDRRGIVQRMAAAKQVGRNAFLHAVHHHHACLKRKDSTEETSELSRSVERRGSIGIQLEVGGLVDQSSASPAKEGTLPNLDVLNEDEDEEEDEPTCCGIRRFTWYLLFVVVVYSVIVLGMQLAAVYMWPRRDMYLPQSKPEPTSDIYESIAERNVPPLQHWGDARFDSFRAIIGTKKPAPYDETNTTNDCISPFWESLLERLSWASNFTNMTDPAKVREVLDLMRLTDSQEARRAVGNLLHHPTPYTAFLDQIRGCALANHPLNAYACEALEQPGLRLPFVVGGSNAASFVSELWDALHLGFVLERISATMTNEPDAQMAITWDISLKDPEYMDSIRVSNREWAIANSLVGSKREMDLLEFKLQKYQSVLEFDREYKLLSVKADDPRAVLSVQRLLALNIIEAAYVDLQGGLDENVALALALAVQAQGRLPHLSSARQLRYPLGKDWVDAYNAWNMGYVSQFNDLQFFPKLLIPSVLCNSHDDRATSWFSARAASLKLFILYQTNRGSEKLTKYNVVVFSEALRREWGRATLEYTPIMPPAPFSTGSLTSMFELLLPPSRHKGFTFTNYWSDEWFRFYGSLVIWASVVSAGLGAEVILGPWLIEKLAAQDASSHTGKVMWHLAQAFFALNLTVAFFSGSALGLPYLVIGLWKCGFPETYSSLKQAYFHALEAGCITADAVACFADGMGSLVHHTTTAFIIIGCMTHIFPVSRVITAACMVPIMQHMIVMLKYQNYDLFCFLSIVLEVWFELEVIVNIWPTSVGVDNFVTGELFFDRIGRASAFTMVISHWLYLIGASVGVVPHWTRVCLDGTIRLPCPRKPKEAAVDVDAKGGPHAGSSVDAASCSTRTQSEVGDKRVSWKTPPPRTSSRSSSSELESSSKRATLESSSKRDKSLHKTNTLQRFSDAISHHHHHQHPHHHHDNRKSSFDLAESSGTEQV